MDLSSTTEQLQQRCRNDTKHHAGSYAPSRAVAPPAPISQPIGRQPVGPRANDNPYGVTPRQGGACDRPTGGAVPVPLSKGSCDRRVSLRSQREGKPEERGATAWPANTSDPAGQPEPRSKGSREHVCVGVSLVDSVCAAGPRATSGSRYLTRVAPTILSDRIAGSVRDASGLDDLRSDALGDNGLLEVRAQSPSGASA